MVRAAAPRALAILVSIVLWFGEGIPQHRNLGAAITAMRLGEVLREHPRIGIDQIEFLGGVQARAEMVKYFPGVHGAVSHGLRLELRCPSERIAEITRFRNRLRSDPWLQRLVPDVNFNVDWRTGSEGFVDPSDIAFIITLFPRPQGP